MKQNFALGSAGLFAAVALAGCGGSPTLGTASNPRVRALDALTTPASVTCSIDGQTITGVTNFGNVSGYTIFTNGNRQVIFADATTGTPVAQQNPLFSLSHHYTVIGYQSSTGPAIMVLVDSNNVGSANGSIRFAKVATGTAATVDVYVTQPGVDITSLSPNFSSVTAGNVSQPYVTEVSGTYEVRETAAGSKTPIIDQQITLSGATATTILDAGGTTFMTLQDQ